MLGETTSEEVEEGVGLGLVEPAAELRVGEGTFELIKQSVGDDELEFTAEPSTHELRRSAGAREQSGNQDVRIENSPHSTPARFVLRLNCKG